MTSLKKYLVAFAATLALAGCGSTTASDAPQQEQQPAVESHGGADLRLETGVSAKDAATTNRIAGRLGPVRQSAAAFGPTCREDYSGQVWSSRGVRPTEFVLHYTVSANRPGWSDVLAIENYFSSTRVASSHFIVDFEGHCLKMVPLSRKAWTQGNANPWATSVEIIATGRETNAQWRASPLIRNGVLAKLVRRVMDYQRLPLRRVDPVGCVFPAGWTDHNHLECGNHHTDVAPAFPFQVFARQLRAVR